MMMRQKLSVHLLGVVLWVMSLHSDIFSSAAHSNRPHIDNDAAFSKLKISEKDLNRSVTFATGVVSRLQRLEMNLRWSHIHVQKGTPSHGELIEASPEMEALVQGRNALIAAKATLHLMNVHCNKHNLSPKDCMRYISKYNLISTPLHSSCPSMKTVCAFEDLHSKYRSFDGSCNSQHDGPRGKSFTSYKRLLPAHYMDGVHEMRRSVNKRFALPSARTVSTSICNHRDVEDHELTLAVMLWTQFIEHDLAHTAANKMIHFEGTIECCDSEGFNLSPRYVHPLCAPINIPDDDEFYSQHAIACMSYVRSVPAMRSDCSFGPIEQVNQATHFLDGSQIYGSNLKKTTQLRKFHNGLLDVSKINNREFLLVSMQPTENCQYATAGNDCFTSGDSRVNMHPHLTAMHTLWHREHNRVAGELALLNPHWNDETLYQEARRIVIAEMQHITYDEWLPVLLGKKYVSKIQQSDAYADNIDPSIANSFANAAIRAINSLMDDKIRLYLENRRVNMSLQLRDHFYRPTTVQEPGHLDALVRGAATQRSKKMDSNYANDITSQMYHNGDYGFDILSLDIQRGRDHGLPSYVAFRKVCGLSDVENFIDLTDTMSAEKIQTLSNVYRSPQDIDLLVGGLSENPDGDSLVGPTLSCIIADQMLRTKRGDRYFYSSKQQPKPFSARQLAEIQQVTLARIFCDNGDDIQMMQRNVFKQVSISNELVSCLSEDIPYMDLKLWKVAFD